MTGPDDRDRDPFAELADLGGPRPLPDSLRRRLERSMLASAGEVLPAGIDAPRPLPLALRLRLEHALTARAATRWRMPVGIAAALVLLLGLASLALVPREDANRRGSDVAVSAGPKATTPAEPTDAALDAPPVSSDATAGAAGSAAVGGAAARPSESRAAGAAASRSTGPPPPFSDGAQSSQANAPAASADSSGGASSSAEKSPSTTSAPERRATGTPLAIAIVTGDAAQEAGFRAYIDLLNRNGGIGNHPVRLDAGRTSGPTPGSLLTVNLSAAQLGGTWGPRLETLAVGDDILRGDVFDFASAPERQGHLIADEVFPDTAAGSTAVVYAGSGAVLGQRVPDAIESVLRSRGVAVVRVPYSGGRVAPTSADAAFLSLDTDGARTWLAEARSTGVAPERGVAGIYSLVDESLFGQVAEGTRAMGPYRFPVGEEAAALRRATNRPMESSVVHGWNTAKMLAVALWRSGATTRDAVAPALRQLAGYDSGMAPPYEVRKGTTSRTPEAQLYVKANEAFTPAGGFRRDPH